MVHFRRQNRRGGTLVEKVRLAAPAGLLLGCALAPAASLALLHHAPLGMAALGTPATTVVLVVLPLACFLLAVLLWQARRRITDLEREQAEKTGVDPLTSLYDRSCFERCLEDAMGRSGVDAPIALIAIDIDRFKSVNDSHGHGAGDRLLVGIAERLRRVVREGDCLARLGGDEFALILTQVDSAAKCAATAHRILDALIAPFDLGVVQIYATLSLGIAMGPQDGDRPETLCRAADLALYRAKHEGRNRFAFFDKTMEQKLHLGQTIEDDLRPAIKADALTILYQPLMAPCGTKMLGLEALVRWHHPQLGLMSPDEFIPVAESRGLIAPLGEWVLRRACHDARRWPGVRMAVNVSPVQFRQPGFVDTVRNIIEVSGIEPGRLDLELTEGVLIQDADQAEMVIMDLRGLGVRMGLDDFGSGYSSLIYLRRFAFDKIKIDRAFLGSLEAIGEGAIILEYIVSLGHSLGLTVTAEGVEHQEQVAFLQKLGCDEMQGFYFAPPLTVAEVDARLSLEAWTRSAVESTVAVKERSAA